MNPVALQKQHMTFHWMEEKAGRLRNAFQISLEMVKTGLVCLYPHPMAIAFYI